VVTPGGPPQPPAQSAPLPEAEPVANLAQPQPATSVSVGTPHTPEAPQMTATASKTPVLVAACAAVIVFAVLAAWAVFGGG